MAVTTTTPVIALHRLPSEVDERVRRACLRARARPIASDALRGEAAAVLIAHLPRRVRRIPPDVLAQAERIDAQIPLLLTCDEALVHPATTLRDARVTLVEHAAEERLYSQIRIALAATSPGGASRSVTDGTESAGPRFWLGVVRPSAVRCFTAGDAVSALVPVRPPQDRAVALAAAHDLVAAGRADAPSALAASLGDGAGLVHLSREHAWSVYWPKEAGGLWLFSSRRLPHVSDLTRASDAPRVLESAAQPGEIVLATARALDTHERRVVDRLSDGGPATLDRLRAFAQPVDGVVMEAR